MTAECKNCTIEFNKKDYRQKFCSQSCSAKYHNVRRLKKLYMPSNRQCVICNNNLKNYQRKFCSNTCEGINKKQTTENKIKNGEHVGVFNLRKYLFSILPNECHLDIIPPTPTPTVTPSPTPVFELAYLFIEPVSGSTSIGQWMYNSGSNFFGFTNLSSPDTSNSAQFNIDMNNYIDYSGWTSGSFPAVRTQPVPQASGGIDSYGNAIVEFNFTTHEVPSGTVNSASWYMWIIPTGATNGEIQTLIDYNNTGNPNVFTTVNTEGTLRANTFTYTGTTIPADTYRIYTTFTDVAFYLNNNNDIYFKGNTVS